ncbi:hypothetical protein E1263_36860 [Kribbella antibiotica]|uniref:DUF2690 domain-containing protein n=1 Tax=Kribbella antibiotica TaxID=190195 RepID=A0A4V2YLE8_9ACTN|nr:hypothetical protein [Kribbella antibiotica]TDD46287.1 hypothetical protein E1263_36860 [Kribbella antibiotica]
MRTLGILLSTAGLVGAGALALVTVPAQAAEAANCTVVSQEDASMLRGNRPPSWGKVYVFKDSCGRFWAEVRMDSKLPANARANAFLVQRGGRTWDCGSGNGLVKENESSCFTQKVRGADGARFRAYGAEYQNYGGGYTELGKNYTKYIR